MFFEAAVDGNTLEMEEDWRGGSPRIPRQLSINHNHVKYFSSSFFFNTKETKSAKTKSARGF